MLTTNDIKKKLRLMKNIQCFRQLPDITASDLAALIMHPKRPKFSNEAKKLSQK